jgi:hypothetical protein
MACIAASPAAAATTTFAPVADSYVAADAPTANYGTSAKLRADGSPVNRSYLRFDVSGLSGTVTRATLRVFNNTALAAPGYAVFGVGSNSWGEKTITFNNAPPLAASATASSGKATASTTTSLDVTPLVAGNGGVSLGLATAGSVAISWPSREGASNQPQLVVETGGSPPPPPPPNGDPVIAAAGDIACDPATSGYNGGAGTASGCRQRYTSDLLTGGGLAAVLTLGDNQYENGELAAYMQSYDPTWGRLKTITHPVAGNHEYNTSSAAAGYFDYFNGTGSLTGPAGDRGKGYYSYDIGAWHFVALNSNCGRVSCAAGSPQDQWLRADLQASPAKCTLAYWHHPLFSSGAHGNIAASKPLFSAFHALGGDVVLNGHDHVYERFAAQTPAGAADSAGGVREFIVGTGGKSQSSISTVKPNSEVRNVGTFGVLRMTLHASSYDWKFTPEAGKTFTDSGTGTCH